MNLPSLLSSFSTNNPRLFQLADRLGMSEQQHIYCKNLRGSAPSFLISSAFLNSSFAGLNHLVICDDAESAAYVQNTIENLTHALDLFYFPSSFRNRKNFSLLNSSHIMLRTETLTKLTAGGNKKIIVTYPEALFEKVVLPNTLSGNIIYLKTTDTIDVEGMIEKLTGYGFERSDFVYEPGQFALRGGIFDIYSFGNEKPYRIELFGNEIDSIRIFDPETQLSERKLVQVSIIPNVETQFGGDDKISLLDFLPENTIVWMNDWDLIKERLVTQED
jgi:transcription-repair coupling factor (superfamily II helicase)